MSIKNVSRKKVFPIAGMMCPACEKKVENGIKKIDGVTFAKADYVQGSVTVEADEQTDFANTVKNAIENVGYSMQSASLKSTVFGFLRFFGAVAVLYALQYLAGALGILDVFYNFPKAEETVGFTALFLIGVFTSVHCVGMCGGINLSVSCGRGVQGTLSYNIGRVVSYTAIGAIVGAIGSVVGFSGSARGTIAIAGGTFMIVMGLNMLGIFPFLRVLTLRFKLPPPITKLFTTAKTGEKNSIKGALLVGLLNGLMPCGPLQTMQIYALSTGSAVKGALSMFLFSAGTVPLMVAFGSLGSLLTKKATKILVTVSSALIILLGIELVKIGLFAAG